jgi:hypothetical protein
VVATEPGVLGGKAVRKHVVLRFGEGERAVALNLSLFVPASAKGPVPVVLQPLFSNPPGLQQLTKTTFNDAPPVADIVGRGYAYAAFRYTEAQADSTKSHEGGVQALAYGAGQTRPAPGEWGAIATWAWIASRVLDFLETEGALDAKRVALVGHSRLGKTALWAGARDERFAAVFASCSGEMGASLARRDYGESLDDVAVVDDLVVDEDLLVAADVDQLVDDVDRHVDAGAEAAGVGEQDLHRDGDDTRRPPPSRAACGTFPSA